MSSDNPSKQLIRKNHGALCKEEEKWEPVSQSGETEERSGEGILPEPSEALGFKLRNQREIRMLNVP